MDNSRKLEILKRNYEMLVKDRVTGEMYDPQVEFEKLLQDPEVVDQMVRMKEERGCGWPVRTAQDCQE